MLDKKIAEKAKISREKILTDIYENHLTELREGKGKIFKISGQYNGVWLEHAYDGVAWADYDKSQKEISLNHVLTFLDGQKENGHIPYCFTEHAGVNGKYGYGYSQLQECVSFAKCCALAMKQNNVSAEYKKGVYEKLKKWDEWLVKYRFKNGLLETYCGYDTGHDMSMRHEGFGKYELNFSADAADKPTDSDVLPEVMPDLNAVVYGSRKALAEIALELGLNAEAAEWNKKAADLKKRIYEYCYDEEDDFFYDVDKNGNKRKIRSISIATLYIERVLDKEEGQRLFKKYFLSPEFFGTPYPYPSVAASDKRFIKNHEGNSWNYYCQGLTMLRTLLWMDDYGLSRYLESNMEKWVTAFTLDETRPFSQELDPFTGKPSPSSTYYSSTMLFYLHALKRLGI